MRFLSEKMQNSNNKGIIKQKSYFSKYYQLFCLLAIKLSTRKLIA
jgi:hypothetical protein